MNYCTNRMSGMCVVYSPPFFYTCKNFLPKKTKKEPPHRNAMCWLLFPFPSFSSSRYYAPIKGYKHPQLLVLRALAHMRIGPLAAVCRRRPHIRHLVASYFRRPPPRHTRVWDPCVCICILLFIFWGVGVFSGGLRKGGGWRSWVDDGIGMLAAQRSEWCVSKECRVRS